MRVVSTVLCGVGVATLLVAPTVTPAWAAARPVEPGVTTLEVPLDAADAGPPVEELLQPASTDELVVTSPEQAVDEFALVGATLPEGVEATDVEVRVRQDDGWSGWQALEPLDEGPDADTAEYAQATQGATAPLWVGDADAIQTRVAVDPGQSVDGIDLALVDPGTSPADGGSEPAASASAATAIPRIITRAQWGADESLRCRSVNYSTTIKAAVLHHTAGSNGYRTQAEAMRQLRADYAYHTKSLGWCDLGYNFVVDRWGNVYEGRAGGVDRAVMGAHSGGFNRDTFGISMLGNYSTVAPPAAMTAAVKDVIAWKLSMYGRDPWEKTTLTSAGGGTARWKAGTVRSLPVVMGHREVGSTSCPGNAGYATLNTIRSGVARTNDAAPFVAALYADLLGRSPANPELDGWSKTIAATGDRWVGVKGFSGSDEFRRRFVTAAYVDVLGRQPDAGGLTGWVADIAARRATLDDLRVRLMQSPEFYQRAGNTDTGYVNALYQRSLNRNASAAEQTGWARIVGAQGRQAAVQGVWNSHESALRRVDRSYGTWLVRRASAAEQEYWARTVLTAGDEAMREAAMVSPEYLARAKGRF